MAKRTCGWVLSLLLFGGLGCSGGGGGTATVITPDGGRADGYRFELPSGGGGSGGATGGGGGGSSGAPSACGGSTSACKAERYVGVKVPLDIYVMFDQSGSMALTDDGQTMRIDAVRSAVEQFLKAPESEGINIGIGYFGQQPLECACTSCNPADYARPGVQMGVLPAHATAMMQSLKAIKPTGETPTGPAIRGACQYATGWRRSNVGHQVAILLVTDGEPKAPLSMANGCNPTLQDAVAAATECRAGGAGLSTYVLGIGPSLQNLNEIAVAGGTKQAYLVANGGTAEILKALHAIRGDATIPCTLKLPTPTAKKLDLGKVNVVHNDAACKPTTVPMAPAAPSCHPQLGGWYFDDPAKPEFIHLCGPSCDLVKTAGSELSVEVGCETVLVP
jgi:hypothetical protein